MSSIRPVDGLLWARPVAKPSFIPISRPKGSKAAGLRYERSLAKFLSPGVIHGQWFEFEDSSGLRYCQPDIIYPMGRYLLAVIEVKYTLVDQAYDQLLDLYGPVVSAAYNVPVGLVTVFKNWDGTAPHLAHTSLSEAASWSKDTGRVALLHWMGQPVVAKPNRRTAGIIELIRRRPSLSADNVPPRRVSEAPGEGWAVRPPSLVPKEMT